MVIALDRKRIHTPIVFIACHARNGWIRGKTIGGRETPTIRIKSVNTVAIYTVVRVADVIITFSIEAAGLVGRTTGTPTQEAHVVIELWRPIDTI